METLSYYKPGTWVYTFTNNDVVKVIITFCRYFK